MMTSFKPPKHGNVKETGRRLALLYGSLLLCISLLIGFQAWDHFSSLPALAWNTSNLKQIHIVDPKDFSFAVFAENRNSDVAFENLLKLIDHDQDIAFAVSLGDMVQKGEKGRYRFFLRQARENLGIPLLTAVGYHELRGKGRDLYHDIFGPLYYSFRIGENYFIVLNDTHKQGLDPSQKEWLEQELGNANGYETRIVFMHAPLHDPRGAKGGPSIPEEASERLIRLFLKYRVTHIFASLGHGYVEGHWQGIPYTMTGGAGAGWSGDDSVGASFHFLKVSMKAGKISVEVERVPAPGYARMGPFGYTAWLWVGSFLRIHGIEAALLLIASILAICIYRIKSRDTLRPRRILSIR
ncbi:MAG: metallophosphoesterase [Proteobacteria bacterium]|nr:metallophosphoesterase [Pseudomonadota bacterium]